MLLYFLCYSFHDLLKVSPFHSYSRKMETSEQSIPITCEKFTQRNDSRQMAAFSHAANLIHMIMQYQFQQTMRSEG